MPAELRNTVLKTPWFSLSTPPPSSTPHTLESRGREGWGKGKYFRNNGNLLPTPPPPPHDHPLPLSIHYFLNWLYVGFTCVVSTSPQPPSHPSALPYTCRWEVKMEKGTTPGTKWIRPLPPPPAPFPPAPCVHHFLPFRSSVFASFSFSFSSFIYPHASTYSPPPYFFELTDSLRTYNELGPGFQRWWWRWRQKSSTKSEVANNTKVSV